MKRYCKKCHDEWNLKSDTVLLKEIDTKRGKEKRWICNACYLRSEITPVNCQTFAIVAENMTDTQDQTYQLGCDVCGKIKNVNVYASRLAPASYAYCDECERRGAEPLGVIFLTLYWRGIPEFSHMPTFLSFHGGRYITFKEAVALYPQLSGSYLEAIDVEDIA